MIVVLTACFPQDRALFLGSVALWGAACALVATILRNFAAYSAALAGAFAPHDLTTGSTSLANSFSPSSHTS